MKKAYGFVADENINIKLDVIAKNFKKETGITLSRAQIIVGLIEREYSIVKETLEK